MKCQYINDCNGSNVSVGTGTCYSEEGIMKCPYLPGNIEDGLQWVTSIRRIARQSAEENNESFRELAPESRINALVKAPLN